MVVVMRLPLACRLMICTCMSCPIYNPYDVDVSDQRQRQESKFGAVETDNRLKIGTEGLCGYGLDVSSADDRASARA